MLSTDRQTNRQTNQRYQKQKVFCQGGHNKSPGSDGYTTEFYKFFCSDLKRIIFDNVQYAFQAKILSLDQRRAVLTLLPTSGKDICFLDNW